MSSFSLHKSPIENKLKICLQNWSKVCSAFRFSSEWNLNMCKINLQLYIHAMSCPVTSVHSYYFRQGFCIDLSCHVMSHPVHSQHLRQGSYTHLSSHITSVHFCHFFTEKKHVHQLSDLFVLDFFIGSENSLIQMEDAETHDRMEGAG